ncbi:MAG: transposase, partial [Nitrospinae bacterium]|nr:transposase [Nitrospinota bacterium]
RKIPQNRSILADQIISLTGIKAEERCPHLLRRVVVRDEVNGREIVLLANHLEFGSSTIASIYKDRWEIEIFFKTLKQHLKVKTFIGKRIAHSNLDSLNNADAAEIPPSPVKGPMVHVKSCNHVKVESL